MTATAHSQLTITDLTDLTIESQTNLYCRASVSTGSASSGPSEDTIDSSCTWSDQIPEATSSYPYIWLKQTIKYEGQDNDFITYTLFTTVDSIKDAIVSGNIINGIATVSYPTDVAGMTIEGKSTQSGTPTPSAPVPIVSVGARNLLDLSKAAFTTGSKTIRGITISAPDKDGWFTVSGTTTAQTSGANAVTLWGVSSVSQPNDILPRVGGNYVEKVWTQGQPFTTGGTKYTDSTHIVVYWDSDNRRVGGYRQDSDTFNVGSYIFRITYYMGEDVPEGLTVDGKFRFMLSRGTDTTVEYMPYGKVALRVNDEIEAEIDLSLTNIFDASNIEKGYFGTSIGQTATVNYSPDTNTYKNACKLEQGKTYTLSWNNTQTKLKAERDINIVDDNGITLNRDIKYTNTGNTLTFTAPVSGWAWICIDAYATNPKLCEGTSTEPQPLRSLPDGTKDELTVDSAGNVSVVRKCDGSKFDPTKSWSSEGNSWKLATPYTQSLGSITMPSMKSAPSTFIFDSTGEANGILDVYSKMGMMSRDSNSVLIDGLQEQVDEVQEQVDEVQKKTNYIHDKTGADIIDENINGLWVSNSETEYNPSDGGAIKLTSDGMNIYKDSADIASFGETVRIGKTNSSRFVVNNKELIAYDESNKEYFNVDESGFSFKENNLLGEEDISDENNDIQISNGKAIINHKTKIYWDSLLIEGKSTQSGTPPTPSNPKKIVSVSAKDGMDNKICIETLGKNLAKTYSYTCTSDGITFKYNNDGFRVSGTATSNVGMPTSKSDDAQTGKFELKAGTYTLLKPENSGSIYIDLLNLDNNSCIATASSQDATFTINDNVTAFVRVKVVSGRTVDETVKIQLEEGSTATDYEPYNNKKIFLELSEPLRSLPDGTKDELTVDSAGNVSVIRRVGSVDLGTFTYTKLSEGVYYTTLADCVYSGGNQNPNGVTVMCGAYAFDGAYGDGSGHKDGTVVVGDSGEKTSVAFYNASVADETAFKTAMNSVELIYELAAPIKEIFENVEIDDFFNSTQSCFSIDADGEVNGTLKVYSKLNGAITISRGDQIYAEYGDRIVLTGGSSNPSEAQCSVVIQGGSRARAGLDIKQGNTTYAHYGWNTIIGNEEQSHLVITNGDISFYGRHSIKDSSSGRISEKYFPNLVLQGAMARFGCNQKESGSKSYIELNKANSFTLFSREDTDENTAFKTMLAVNPGSLTLYNKEGTDAFTIDTDLINGMNNAFTFDNNGFTISEYKISEDGTVSKNLDNAIVMTNSGIEFKNNGQTVASITDEKLTIAKAQITREHAMAGIDDNIPYGFKFFIRNNRNMGLKWVDEL